MTPIEETETVRALLLEIASGCETAADVAAKLRVLGIRGKRGYGGACPIYQWLAMHGLAHWNVGLTSALARGWQQVTTPLVIRAFIDLFDGRAFPDLEAA